MLMLITTNPQLTLWESILPPGYQDLPRELAAVDALLDDPDVDVAIGRARRQGVSTHDIAVAVDSHIDHFAALFCFGQLDCLGHLWKIWMTSAVGLQDNHRITACECLLPSHADRVPAPAAAGDFAAFGGQSDIGSAFVTRDNLNRQS